MIDLLPQFGSLAVTVVAFVVALSIVVAIHEYGHYIVGRWSGIRAEVFSLGFGPVLASRIDRHGTRWQLAALPLGGYVKFLGDANASSVGGDLARVPAAERRATMLGAPLWARAATVAAGPLANFLLALAVFAALALGAGRAADPLTVAALAALPEIPDGGLRAGDEIIAIDGRPVTVDTFVDVAFATDPLPAVPYLVRRDGAEVTVPGPHPFPPLASTVNPGSAAWAAGVRPGDVVLSVDGTPVHAFEQVQEIATGSDGRPLALEIWRDGATRAVTLTPRRTDVPVGGGRFETRWLLGVVGGYAFTPATVSPGLLGALAAAFDQLLFILGSTISGVAHVVSGAISTCNISGPVGIAEASGAMASQGTLSFIGFIGTLSAAVGLMNLFPIPILDGGHLVFHAYEAVTRRRPSDGALRALMAVGLTLLLGLMVWALANDLVLCP